MSTYNGWTNYETWRVNLEIFDGCAGSDFLARERKGRREYVTDLSQILCDHALDRIEQDGQGLALDYARAFLEAVNYREIAENMADAEAEAEADEAEAGDEEDDELAEA
jgi:hypothetical protein